MTLADLTPAERQKLLGMARARDLVRGGADTPPIVPAARDGRVPLSFAQARLWFLEQLGDLGGTYHMRTRMRLRGELNRAALVRALDRIVARHEALRTTFAQVDGVPEQRIAPAGAVGFALAEHDLAGAADARARFGQLAAEEAAAPFDLERGPLIRGGLIRMAADEHVLLLTMHHIVSDDWSLGVLTHELGALYDAFRRGEPDPLPPLPVQYADYAVWQRKWVEGDVLQRQADYWTRTLSGAPELLDLPADHPRPARAGHAGARLGLVLDEGLTAGLKELSRRHGTTLFMTLLAGWAAVLGRLSGHDDVVIGTPTAGRGRREVEGLIGFFVNTLAMRVDLSGAPTVAQLLERVKERALGAQQHQDIPFEQVVELVDPARSLSHHPLFQVMFVWQNTPRTGGQPLAGLEPSGEAGGAGGDAADVQAKFDLSLALGERAGRIVGGVTFATALFERATVERYAGYLRRVLEEMVADDAQRVERLALLPASERGRVVEEWNRTDADYPAGSCIHELFEAQVARTPGAAAVVFDGGQLTYAELNASANRLAHALRGRGVGPEVRVAICLERGPQMVAALLGVLKAGGAYVPLDPAYPEERIRWMLGDSAPAALLTQASLAARFAGAAMPVLALDATPSWWAAQADTDPKRGGLAPENLAYVIYTSGSTGRPKGVLVPHCGLCNFAVAQQRAFGMGPGDRVLQFASISFDAAVSELLMALAWGAALCVGPREELLPGPGLLAFLRRHAVTTVTLPPSALGALPVEELPALRTITVAGEALPAELVARWGARHRLWNLYGPTEATIWSTAAECSDPERKPVIGAPIPNTRAYVLDAGGEPLPVGLPGELYIGGVGVARGYLGRPGLTAERFVPDAFGREAGARLYRTGDLARWTADGTLDYVGRADHQLKVRGFRIEPGEIEARLAAHPAVREAVVIAREDVPGDRRLVAYVVGTAGAAADALRAHLAETLPEYMVPAAYVRLDGWPLTPNGKLDRKALPAPAGDAHAAREYDPPVGETEQAVAEIWAEVLRVDRVGRHDHFFELGGHSLLAVQVISRVRQVLAVEAALRDLFTRPVLKDFARELEMAARAELPPIQPAAREGRVPLSFAQARLWFLDRLGGLGSAYHISKRIPFPGELDRGALVRALDGIVARHEALRTVFAETDGVPEQRIAPAGAGFHLAEHDLSGEDDRRAALDRLMAEEAHAPFDLERGPLIRGRLIRLAADHHVLLLTMHHIVSDAWSMGVLTHELATLYAAHREGREAGLPALPVQYADYAAWQRQWVEGDVLQEQEDYWAETLAGAPELLELPTDHPRPAKMDHAGALLGVELGEELTAGLKALGRRHGTTLFITLLAGWAAVLGRLAGRDDVVVGTPVANRGRREIEGLIGFFVNTLALRLDLSGSPTVAELLARVKERALGAQHHQDIPFEQVVELLDPVRSLSHSPLFQVMFTWQDTQRGAGLAPPAPQGGRAGAGPSQVQAKFDLSLSLRDTGDRIVGGVTYATALFERATVKRFVGYLPRVLEQMVAGENRRVERLALLVGDERSMVLEEWNRTEAGYPEGVCVHQLFEAQVGRTPGAVAVVSEGEELTYGELNARSNRLAHHLRSLGVGPDARVGICVERSPEMVVALLAVLKAGGAYVPLDPEYPEDRLRHMLDDSAPAVLLTPAALAERFADVAVRRIRVDADRAEWAHRPETDPPRGALTPEHLAYVIYTSGSTGQPKGVMNQHRALVNRLAWGQRAWEIGAGDTVLCKTSLSFDGSVREIFLPLMAGARVVLARPGGQRDPDYLLEVIGRAGVTTVNVVPSLLQLLLDAPEVERLGVLARVLCGGEALSSALLERFAQRLPGVELHNLYGPSEAATAVTWPRCVPEPGRGVVPIGAPAANTRAYVVDRAGEPVPVGVAGELCIGGVPVARGYLGRAALTAERFAPDPFGGEPGARVYRTGDVVRWLGDGRLEFVGRNDAQVKVRGFRVEPGEIEARLREHPSVRDAVVVAREDVPGDRRLVAYCVAGEALDVEAVRAHVAARLPEYMVPAACVRLERLPLTPSGKLDRRALPAPEGDAYAAREYEAPEGTTEQALAEIWAEVLRLERVGRWDNFFELGGHSLLAVQVISRVRQVLEVEVALGELFTRPVLKEFARELETAAQSDLAPIEPVSRDGRIPLSFAQQRLWFLAQLRDLGSTYHISRRRRLRGELDRAALVRALDRIVARHEALRTVFAHAGGVPEQRIAPEDTGFLLVEHDLEGRGDARAELGRLAAAETNAPFDLERGPLIRGRLVRLAADDHVLLLTMHHIVSDGWSMGVLVGELDALYAAFRRGAPDPLPALPVQYADYAVWQRRWLDGEVLREQAEYWMRTLAGAPELLELPTDRPRPAQMDHAGAQLRVALDEALTAGLKTLSRRHGTTLFMTLLAGWAVVLGRLSGQADVVIGSPMAGRGRREIEGLIGFFVNTLALRVDLSGAPTVAALLARVKERVLGAQHHQDIPFEQVVERVDPARSLAHHPLFQVLFAWQNTPRGDGLSLPGLEAGGVGGVDAGPSQVQANRDLSITLQEAGGRIVGSVAYATALFDRATVERHLGYLRRVLEEMAADDRRGVDRLALMSDDERARVVVEWNQTEMAVPDGSCVHQLFEAQVERSPDADAVVFAGERLSYARLNARANQLAHHLRALGVGPDVRVAICVERSLEMMVGLLGVLKAGGAYVPLDPGYPAERLAWMLADSAPAAVLTQTALRDRVDAAGVPVLELDNASSWSGRPETNPDRDSLTPAHLAYVIYTSGSTGTPKGVTVEHRAVVNQLAWAQRTWALEAHEAVLQRISLSFDVSVRELFWPLSVGARLVLARPAGHSDPGELVETIAREGIGTVHMVPSLLQPLLEHPRVGECTGLARVMCGGEVLSPALARRFHERLPRATLNHMYGPTETTVAVTTWRSRPDELDGRLPIGRPVANTRAYVLDGGGAPVPVGVAGELYVGGAQVARGYLGAPEMTAERFVADPFGGEAGGRLYRTGDLARWRADGTLDFLGRVDHQVKVRGFRIELGEIEARLAGHPAVREAVVLAREDAPGEKRLVAYVIGDDAAGADVLRAHLAETLPEHMVPAAYVRVDAWPLTPNGKLDRKALPAPEGDAFAAREYEPPVGETEAALAGIWAEVLGVDRVGRGDHFFELGGHSLLAVQVISRVRQLLFAEVALGELFTRPVLADFAGELATAARSELPPIEPAPRDGPIPLSFAQQRLWFLEQLGGLGSAYHMRTRRRLRGELDRAALARALDDVVARHEALRTVFPQVDGAPEQRIAPAGAGFHLVEHDLRERADARAELDRLAAEEARTPFDLERGPLIRGRLFRLADDDHVLIVAMHHIVSDGWSMGVLFRELSALYAAHRQGREAALPALPVQYADYAVWQRRWVGGEVLRQQADYWTRTLAGAPGLLALPTDHPRPAQVNHAGAHLAVELDETLTAGLKALSRRHGATPFMALLAGWAAVLGRLSGQHDVVIGTPTANRGLREIEGLIGFFVNTLALRVDLSGSPTVAQVLGRVKERALGAQAHQDIPFEQVVERVDPARSLSHTPLFQAMFTWQNAPEGELELPGLALAAGSASRPAPAGQAAESQAAKFDLALTLAERGGRIAGSLTYATALFERATVERHVAYLRRVLEAMVADETQRVERLALLSADERSQMLEEWNRTGADYPSGSCIHQLFERQVERAPDAEAVIFGGERVSYGELNARANRLAHHLRSLGVGPDVRVAISVERGVEMVAAVLAVLKAGGAYVPLDPAYPEDRLRWMLEDSAPAALLTQTSLAARFADLPVPVLELDTAVQAWASESAANPERGGLTPEHLAYVIYTSGSTGRPKGVLVPHRGLCNVAAAQQRDFGVGPGDRVLQFASLSFDAAAFELVMALASGAALCLAPREELLPGPGLLGVLRKHAVTTVTLPPTALAALPVEELPALRTITVAGEALPAELVERWGGRHRLWNLYGPTEATIWSTAAECVDAERKPDIGGPIANVRAYVLDTGMEPLPPGVAAELFVGGAGVARGYLGRPGLTAERFVPDPFGGEAGARLYRTGDLARWTADGRLHFIGRADHQVKVRGFRIEPGEVEARLLEHPAVDEAVVVAREDVPGETRLVAYVAGAAVEAEALRAHLLERLPEHMVPAAYVHLPALPLTPNGKVDRKALPAPGGSAFARRGYEAPVGDTEQALAGIWAEVLGVERVGRHDGFFELGGHSLLAVTLIGRMRKQGLHADVRALFATPTLAAFAAAIESAPRELDVPANLIPDPAPRTGEPDDDEEDVEMFL